MPVTVFNEKVGDVDVKAVVDDNGYSDVTSDRGDTHLVVSSNYRGIFTIVGSEGSTDAEQNDLKDRIEFRAGDAVLAVVRTDRRCGGSTITVTDFAGNVILTVTGYLGAMCAGVTVKTVNDTVLTSNEESYKLEGDYMVTEYKVTLPDGRVIRNTNVHPANQE